VLDSGAAACTVDSFDFRHDTRHGHCGWLSQRMMATVHNLLVQRMLATIESDYAAALTVRTLSKAIGRQPAYLGRVFRQVVGSTVRDYLTRVRLNRAAQLIRDGVKIEAVALSVGYRSKKNFYRQFKRRYGTTPLPYRSGTGEL
jgi:two-component system response regulator YesN